MRTPLTGKYAFEIIENRNWSSGMISRKRKIETLRNVFFFTHGKIEKRFRAMIISTKRQNIGF